MAPLQPTHFLLVSKELRYAVLSHSQVMVVNRSVLRPRAEDVGAPGERSDTARVSLELTHHFLGLQVPDLHHATVSSHAQVGAPPRPIDRSDFVCVA